MHPNCDGVSAVGEHTGGLPDIIESLSNSMEQQKMVIVSVLQWLEGKPLCSLDLEVWTLGPELVVLSMETFGGTVGGKTLRADL